jgi:hypothetical protein
VGGSHWGSHPGYIWVVSEFGCTARAHQLALLEWQLMKVGGGGWGVGGGVVTPGVTLGSGMAAPWGLPWRGNLWQGGWSRYIQAAGRTMGVRQWQAVAQCGCTSWPCWSGSS